MRMEWRNGNCADQYAQAWTYSNGKCIVQENNPSGSSRASKLTCDANKNVVEAFYNNADCSGDPSHQVAHHNSASCEAQGSRSWKYVCGTNADVYKAAKPYWTARPAAVPTPPPPTTPTNAEKWLVIYGYSTADCSGKPVAAVNRQLGESNCLWNYYFEVTAGEVLIKGLSACGATGETPSSTKMMNVGDCVDKTSDGVASSIQTAYIDAPAMGSLTRMSYSTADCSGNPFRAWSVDKFGRQPVPSEEAEVKAIYTQYVNGIVHMQNFNNMAYLNPTGYAQGFPTNVCTASAAQVPQVAGETAFQWFYTPGTSMAGFETIVENTDCKVQWSACSADCTATHTVTVAQSGSGSACPASPRTCNPGEDACPANVNCVGAYLECQVDCTKTYVVSTLKSGAGSACPHLHDSVASCTVGQGSCAFIYDTDCAGSWAPCDSACKKYYLVSRPAAGAGTPCPTSPEFCPAGEGDCPAEANQPNGPFDGARSVAPLPFFLLALVALLF